MTDPTNKESKEDPAEKIGAGITDPNPDGGLARTLRGQQIVVVGGTSRMGLGAVRAAAEVGAEVVVASPEIPGDLAGPQDGDNR